MSFNVGPSMPALDGLPRLNELVSAVLKVFPGHASLAAKSFAARSNAVLEISEKVAVLIESLAPHVAGGMETLCRDYRFLCEDIMPPEDLFFRRTGTYRLSHFEQAYAEVYTNTTFMARYMNGVLVSHAMWANHAHATEHYVDTYLPSLPDKFDHLEIGPGHGLLLYFAAVHPGMGSARAWDVSATSVEHTRHALEVFGVTRHVTVELRNLLDAETVDGVENRFDSIVMSEVLEHLEDPVAALGLARRHLRPGGRIWVNVPANSPAPDHLFLIKSPEHAVDLVAEAGLEIENSAAFPMTGLTLEGARRRQCTISCIVTGREPG